MLSTTRSEPIVPYEQDLIKLYKDKIFLCLQSSLIELIHSTTLFIYKGNSFYKKNYSAFIDDIASELYSSYLNQKGLKYEHSSYTTLTTINASFLKQQTCLQKIYNTVCSEGILELDPQKTYENVIVEITKNDFKTTFNFLIDLDLIKEILNTGTYKPVDSTPMVRQNTYVSTNCIITNKLITPSQRFALTDITKYLQPVGAQLLSFFSPATPAVTAAVVEPSFVVEELDDNSEHNELDDATESNLKPIIYFSDEPIELDCIGVDTAKNVVQVVMEAFENANLLTSAASSKYVFK